VGWGRVEWGAVGWAGVGCRLQLVMPRNVSRLLDSARPIIHQACRKLDDSAGRHASSTRLGSHSSFSLTVSGEPAISSEVPERRWGPGAAVNIHQPNMPHAILTLAYSCAGDLHKGWHSKAPCKLPARAESAARAGHTSSSRRESGSLREPQGASPRLPGELKPLGSVKGPKQRPGNEGGGFHVVSGR